MVREFVKRVFNGSAKPLLVHLVEKGDVTEEEIKEISKLLKDKRRKMILESLLNNFASWALQVLALGAVGAVLPALFRMRHPRSQLVYGQLVLLACLILPLIQPWLPPVGRYRATRRRCASPQLLPAAASAPAVTASALAEVLLWVFVAGVGIRLCWIGAGLAQLRRYRRKARPRIRFRPRSPRPVR
jgi:hypothetical protein